jgi:hypothetical protein
MNLKATGREDVAGICVAEGRQNWGAFMSEGSDFINDGEFIGEPRDYKLHLPM